MDGTTVWVENSISLIRDENEGAIPLDISLGVATTKTGETSLSELYKQADDFMYNGNTFH